MICIKKNLINCIAYLEDLTNEILWIVKKHNQKRQKTGIQTFFSVVGIKRQSKLEVLGMSFQKQEIIYYMADIAFYKTVRAFSSFDDKNQAIFIYRLNLAYKLSSG